MRLMRVVVRLQTSSPMGGDGPSGSRVWWRFRQALGPRRASPGPIKVNASQTKQRCITVHAMGTIAGAELAEHLGDCAVIMHRQPTGALVPLCRLACLCRLKQPASAWEDGFQLLSAPAPIPPFKTALLSSSTAFHCLPMSSNARAYSPNSPPRASSATG